MGRAQRRRTQGESNMRRLSLISLAVLFTATACGTAPQNDADDFSGLVGSDEKSDIFSTNMKLVKSVHYGDSVPEVAYTPTPRYRAVKIATKAGDVVDLWVRAADE